MSHKLGCGHVEIKSCSELLTSYVLYNLLHKPPLRPLAPPPMDAFIDYHLGRDKLDQDMAVFTTGFTSLLVNSCTGGQRRGEEYFRGILTN